MSFVFPLSNAVRDARRLSPSHWAIGEQPVTDGVSLASLALLCVVSAAIVAVGTVAVGRRDIRGA